MFRHAMRVRRRERSVGCDDGTFRFPKECNFVARNDNVERLTFNEERGTRNDERAAGQRFRV